MAITEVNEFLKMVPVVRGTPHRYLWSSYDAEADLLYINVKKPSHATDSELTEDDVLIRYERAVESLAVVNDFDPLEDRCAGFGASGTQKKTGPRRRALANPRQVGKQTFRAGRTGH